MPPNVSLNVPKEEIAKHIVEFVKQTPDPWEVEKYGGGKTLLSEEEAAKLKGDGDEDL